MRKFFDVFISVLLCIALFVCTLTFSIGLPIYIRPFYYSHIEPLGLPAATGYTAEEIKASYDELLDYLTLPHREFGTGVFRHSEQGKAHFEDCKDLFNLNFFGFLVSATIIAVIFLLNRKKKIRLCKIGKMGMPAVTGTASLSLFGIIGFLVAVNFNAAFDIFHKLFFTGKENWLFYEKLDPIILALPQQFFINCAVLICVSIITISVLLIVFDRFVVKNSKNKFSTQ